MAVQKKLYTIEEFEAFADSGGNGGRLLELINGEIVEKVPTEEHSQVIINFISILSAHVKPNKLGRLNTDARHRAPNDPQNARIPDVSFTHKERLQPVVKQGSVQHMPDLAIEVKSPDDDPDTMREKAAYYLNRGSKLVWLAFPISRTIEAQTKAADGSIQRRTYGADDMVDGGDVLPGFSVRVAEIFEIDEA